MRESAGCTQEKMADYLSLSRSAYSNYEAGLRDVPLNVLEKIADFSGVGLDVLFEEDETKVRSVLLTAFRAEDLSATDMKEVAAFKAIALEYLKMKRMLENE